MAIYNTPDGRQVVGSTVAGNDYHGFNGKRDIIIQLTEDGATTDGLNALEYLKAYAVEQNKQNKPIFPNGTRVFISSNGYTKAVEADDIVIDGDNIAIGGIKWDGSAWDYSEAGQTGSGLPIVTGDDDGKVLTVVDGAWAAANGGSGGGVLVVHEADGALDKTYKQIVDALHTYGVILEWTHENGVIEVYYVSDYGNVESLYTISFHTDSAQTSASGKVHYYVAESENDYPTNDD